MLLKNKNHFHHCEFQMSSIKLRQVILPGARLEETYDTLLVLEWGEYPWRKQDFNSLVCICHRLKIKRVVFMKPEEGDISTFALNQLLPWYNENGYPFLNHLKVIQIQCNTHHPALITLARYSRVKEVFWYLKSYVGQNQSMWIDHIFYHMDPKLLKCNHSIEKIKFLSDAWNPGKHEYRPIQIDLRLSEPGLAAFKNCSLWMEKNATGWRNCTKAILILLCLKKRVHYMFSCLNRDALKIIADLVWKTRGTEVWTTQKAE
jgi:hypothetical protein